MSQSTQSNAHAASSPSSKRDSDAPISGIRESLVIPAQPPRPTPRATPRQGRNMTVGGMGPVLQAAPVPEATRSNRETSQTLRWWSGLHVAKGLPTPPARSETSQTLHGLPPLSPEPPPVELPEMAPQSHRAERSMTCNVWPPPPSVLRAIAAEQPKPRPVPSRLPPISAFINAVRRPKPVAPELAAALTGRLALPAPPPDFYGKLIVANAPVDRTLAPRSFGGALSRRGSQAWASSVALAVVAFLASATVILAFVLR